MNVFAAIDTNSKEEKKEIIYRCNYRLKYGKDKCDNDNSIDEKFIDNMISQQLFIINMNIENMEASLKR